MGDVILSTPVFRAVREEYPDSHIAVMVRPYTRECVEGNPYINEVIIYDKYGRHKSVSDSLRFTLDLRKKNFDLALILHPTNRVNLITFLAGIPRRVGFNRKLGFLLTKRITHTKQLGEKHELEYTLDIIRSIGIVPRSKSLYMPLKKDAARRIEKRLSGCGVTTDDRLVAVHPSASCPSKRWPAERFARVADRLMKEDGVKIVLISGPDGKKDARDTKEKMENEPIDLSGRTSISELASLFKRCSLFISNDSGPVHVASAVGTPVISIFGRKDRGLGPKRWGPTGDCDIILHKDAGCIRCLAHNCDKDFLCLNNVSEDEVVRLAQNLLKTGGHHVAGYVV
jgi:heptosyltransferase-2